uniref:NAD(P)(+)--arginine ADP-ribosyltransferase n=1 Tax=Oryzias latipes TaxID=8090 RepID=A0A3P9I8U3_ORYLA
MTRFVFLLLCFSADMRLLTAKTKTEGNIFSKASYGPQINPGKSSSQETVKSVFAAPEEPHGVENVSSQSVQQKATDASRKFSPHRWPLPLSLFPNSVDDMYYGCSNKMLIKVKRDYLPKSTREGFQSTRTKLCAFGAMQSRDPYDPLSWDHFRALCAYTAGAYDSLNHAVREGKASYNISFQFHALHFFLSDAIRLLKLNQRTCYTVVRRSRRLFVGEPGQTIRFGSFASSSLNKKLFNFGRTTCFEIRTCFGAYLKSYSDFGADEDEVLIPPYEMFRITSVDESGRNPLECEVLYTLETAGIYSTLNCQAVDL